MLKRFFQKPLLHLRHSKNIQKSCFHSLTAISSTDGRYAKATDPLREYFSEYALMKYRVFVEIEWFKKLFTADIITSSQSNLKEIVEKETQFLQNIFDNFDIKAAERIKEIERVTNHDVKAVEYYLKEEFEKNPNLEHLKEYIHFSCTSEDINNLSYALMLNHSLNNVVFPKIDEMISLLVEMSEKYADIPMIGRTHGQAATPSTVGKELGNFAYRASCQMKLIRHIEILGKFNGATGNLNAHVVSFPEKDWVQISQDFVESLGVTWNPYTTQIEPHDGIANLSVLVAVLNTQLIDFSRDMWSYIQMGYFKQRAVAGEIGSSTMPHKINPIDFENAEGNLGVANVMYQHFATKLPVSRLQRDLSDSTVLRNLGVAFALSFQSYCSLLKGLKKLEVNEPLLRQELDRHYELLAEPIQTVMRKYEIENPYEKLKELTRGKDISTEDFRAFIESLDLPESEKQRMLDLTPELYVGLAPYFARNVKKYIDEK